MPIAQRDERALWEQFRSACDAVFDARQAKRKEEDGKKSEHRRALEELTAQLETLARAPDKSDQDLKRALREAQEQWKKLTMTTDQASREAVRDAVHATEPRFRKAKSAVEAALTGRARSREAPPGRCSRRRNSCASRSTGPCFRAPMRTARRAR
jgi:membrane-associated HD superfamily phosphohydrolase